MKYPRFLDSKTIRLLDFKNQSYKGMIKEWRANIPTKTV